MGLKIVTDDYGMSTQTNAAISELVEKKIVSKISVMVTRSDDLLNNSLKEPAEIGLHVNLTANADLVDIQADISSPLKLISALYSGRLTIDNLVENIGHQFQKLRDKDFHISYIDTHQHVHIIPKVLESLVRFSKKSGINTIRCITLENKHYPFYFLSLVRCGFIKQVPKTIVLYLMGIAMKRKLDNARISYCRNLILMPLAVEGDYKRLLDIYRDKFMKTVNEAEIVAHPGLNSTDNQYDEYISGRVVEYQSLKSLPAE